MVLGAETPCVNNEQNTASNSDSSVAGNAGAGNTDQAQSATTTLSPQSAEAGSIAQPGSFKLRFIAAGVLTLLSFLGWLTLISNPGQQPSFLTSIVIIAAASSALLAELIVAWVVRPRRHSPFDLLPLAGTALFIAASITALTEVSVGNAAFNPLLAVAPTLAAAAMCLGSAFSMLGSAVARRDNDYLYPRSVTLREPLKLGERITLRQGDLVPVDARVESGSLGLDERAYTTVPTFRIREEQDVVYAGSEVIAGSAEVTVLNPAVDSCLTQLQRVVEPMVAEAEQGLERADSRATRWSALSVMFIAIAAAIFWNERSQGYVQALSAAGLVALFGAVCQVGELLYGQRRGLVRRWVSKGFILAGASSCGELAKVRAVECDASRCGEGSFPRVVELEVLDDRLSPQALSDFLASLLGRAEDAYLVAAGDYCRRSCSKLSLERAIDLREYPGRGICGVIHGVELSVGSEDFLVERGIMVQPSEGAAQQEQEAARLALGERLFLAAISDEVVARIRVNSDQGDLVPAEGHNTLSGDITVALSSGAARDLGEETLLIRGRESDLVGQVAKTDLNLFNLEEGAVRRGTVIALTPDLSPIDALLRECRESVRSIERSRLLVAFGGLAVVVAAFAGIVTPIIPLSITLLVGLSAHLSQRGA